MPVTFKSERRKILKDMYNDMCDAYVESVIASKHLKNEKLEEIKQDVEEWKTEFRLLIESI